MTCTSYVPSNIHSIPIYKLQYKYTMSKLHSLLVNNTEMNLLDQIKITIKLKVTTGKQSLKKIID